MFAPMNLPIPLLKNHLKSVEYYGVIAWHRKTTTNKMAMEVKIDEMIGFIKIAIKNNFKVVVLLSI